MPRIKPTPDIRISIRDEDYLITNCENTIVDVEGISELVYQTKFRFDLALEEYDIIAPENTVLQADQSANYRQMKFFLETVFHNSSHYSEGIEIAHKGAIRPSDSKRMQNTYRKVPPRCRALYKFDLQGNRK